MFKHLHKASAFVLACCAFLAGGEALAQTNPQPQSLPYSQDFSSLEHASTAYPDGWQGWLLSTSPGANFRTTPATADRAMLGGSTSTTTNGAVHNYNGKIGFLNSGSVDLSLAFAISTQQKQAVKVSFEMMTLRNPYDGGSNTRINEVVLQYRVGTSGDFINLDGTAYQNNTEKWTTSGNTAPQKLETFTITLPEAAENQEVVQLRWASRQISGGGSRPSFAVDNIEVSSLSDSKNPIVLAPASLAFGDVVLNQPNVSSYTLASANITGNVQLSATGGFMVSKQATSGFAASISFSAEEMAANPTVFVRVTPTILGALTGTIAHSGTGIATAVTELSANAVSPYVQNFNNCGTALPGGWKAYSVTGDQVWGCTTFGRETETSGRNNGVQINGFAGSARDNEDWLISPALDLSAFNIAALSFWTRTAFQGPGLKLMVSTNYDGTSAPATATWTELNGDFPAAASDVWKQSIVNLTAYKGTAVHVAFVYTSGVDLNAARWTLDDFAVENVDQLLVANEFSVDFGLVEVPNASAPYTFNFSALGYPAGMTLSVGTDFELSKNGQTYASSLFYTAAETGATNQVYVRYKPGSTKLRSTGQLTYSSGDFTVVKGVLTGTSLPKSSTLDIVSWNLEWFGADKDDRGQELGPDNEELQFANAKKALQTLDADIIAFQEIANDAAMVSLMAELPAYDFVRSDVHSYSWDPSRNLVPQKLYVAYKKDVVKVKSQKVLLHKLYQDVLAGTATLPDYPAAQTSFWASGRLPLLVELEATVNGVTQQIYVVNLHTRANSGTNVTPYNQRKYDVQVLKDSLAAQYPNVNLVMLGDMNEDVDVSVVNNLPSSLNSFVLDSNYKALTYDLSVAGGYTYASGSFQSFLDHIIVSKSLVDEYIEESIAIENQLLSLIPNYRNTTSDHVPVSARFSFGATPAVAFSAPTLTATEGDAPVTVTMNISAAQPKAHTVYLTVKDGATATAVDYTTAPVAASNVIAVEVPAYASTASFEVSIADDKLTEPTEQVSFYINNVTTDLGMAAAARSFTLAIRDNDFPVGIANGQELAFRLYPNPTQGAVVNISLPAEVSVLEEMTLELRSANGTKMYELGGNLSSVQQQLNEKVAGLRNGMYYVQVLVQGKVYQAKLVRN
ncbi:T9SS-dependent choice-of-anchor J family protein [Pontibacter lucknowensis]|uniref:Por secretion system C-terminal sorting domain-containing protein n=2 Tax=Pontibacter TaxID=323449 RepID=A0A1N6ZX85_9BACT|nr:choice-of-anchor J domain-containing protein [Pontibacter lucknowensis]SIR31411.1 Por secretion system C-terminal sorting domain-containing protein [Pontibacter lucknowensis]